jgi:hypothetical protein
MPLQRTPSCSCDGGCPRCQKPDASDGSFQNPPSAPAHISTVLRSPGDALDDRARAFMEPQFGQDFSGVRVHTDAPAAQSAGAIDALAYTVGSHIVFGTGQFAPGSSAGQRLLAHELTHVVQQGGDSSTSGDLSLGRPDSPLEREAEHVSASITSEGATGASSIHSAGAGQIQRQGYGDVRLAEHHDEVQARLTLDYKKAQKGNKANARSGPAWESKLATAAGGKYKAWHDLWVAKQFDTFADRVASFQIDSNLPEKSVDGILGAQTWARLAGIGEAMAGIEAVTWPKAETTCTLATEERITRGYKLATGRSFELPEDKTKSEFHVILESMANRLLDVPVEYRATGPAGAFVYAGLGEFVSESDIWAGKLQPGAVVQVWNFREDYDLMRIGQKKENGKMRRIQDSDGKFLGFNGTSFVFVEYDAKNSEIMWVRHGGRFQPKSRSSYAVWIAANPTTSEGAVEAK